MTNTPLTSARSLFTSQDGSNAPDSTRFVWLTNFEAEPFWTPKGMLQLPKISQSEDTAVVNRLEEISLLLVEHPDYLILRQPSDSAFLSYLTGLGFRLPQILSVNAPDKVTPISKAILEDDSFCDSLSALAQANEDTFLMPFAMTNLEEAIMERTKLKTLGPPASVYERVNSKIYSRKLSKELGLQTIKGWECESLESLEAAFQEAKEILATGQKLVLKEAMGVSGKGIFLIDAPQKFDSLLTMLRRKARTATVCAFVLEAWQQKLKDINYQLLITPSGSVKLLSIKEIIAEAGAHLGHRFPAELTADQLDCYHQAADVIGSRLFEEGVTGIVGVDSIISETGELFPLLEINARFNMSTFQLKIESLIKPQSKVMARYYPLLLEKTLEFERMADGLKDILFHPQRDSGGVLLQNFATVNVNHDPEAKKPFKGRLYALVIGDNDEQVRQLDTQMLARLAQLSSAQA